MANANLELLDDDTLMDDVNLEDEDLDSGVDEDDEDVEPEDLEDAIEEDEEDEDDSTEEDSDENEPATLFDKKQQAEVNKLIKARLERQEAKLVKDLTRAAGVEIAHEEIAPAARLWGLLKANPQLSKEVDGLILLSLQGGKAKAPDAVDNSTDAVAQRLELKEAILDLKASDKTFGKHADKIVAWAENEGYKINSAKSLKMAYLAWKGSQGKVEEVVQKATAQRKQNNKKAMQKRATVQSTKAGTTRSGKTNYAKMSDASVLASEGLSLFTDD